MVFELKISLINFGSNLMFLILPPLNSNSGSATGVHGLELTQSEVVELVGRNGSEKFSCCDNVVIVW